MSTPLRYVYRGSASSYNYNYGGELLANKGGFELLPYDDEVLGCPFPVGCPTNSGSSDQLVVGDTLSAVVYCPFVKIEWFNSNNVLLGIGLTYTTTDTDIDYRIYFKVTYPDGSTDNSSLTCFGVVVADSFRYWFQLWQTTGAFPRGHIFSSVVDNDGSLYLSYYTSNLLLPSVHKISNNVQIQWGVTFPLDPAFVRTVLNDAGSSYYLVNSSSTTIDFLAWQWSPGPNYPIRIYRYCLDKTTGSIVSCISTDFDPPTADTGGYFAIFDVKIDNSGNYYCIFRYSINAEIWVPSVAKFDSNLNFIWGKIFQRRKYRDGTCIADTSNGYPSLTVSDSSLIGCDWRNDSNRVCNNYFELDFDGNVINLFKSKFSTPDFPSDLNPFHVRSVCRDSSGNIYGVGTYDSNFAASNVIVYKDLPSDTTVWAFSIGATWSGTGVGGPLILLEGNQLAVINSKLVLAAPWEYGSGGATVRQIIVCVFDTDTGSMEQAIGIRPNSDVGQGLILQPMPENSKFLIQTDYGWRIRLDVTDLPASGNYFCTDIPAAKYTVYTLTPSVSSSIFYRFDGCAPPGFVDANLGAYFTPSTPVATASGVTNRTFAYFGGQDIP